MICPGCQKHNHDDVKFCRHCGSRLERRTCKNGHPLPDGMDECVHCPKATVAEAAPGAAPPAGHPGTVVVPPEELAASGVVPEGHGAAGRPARGTVVQVPGQAPEPVAAPASPIEAAPRSGASPLVGFLVSFSQDPNGVFWPLRYGRTAIGSADGSTVRLVDARVSGAHARILVHHDEARPKIWAEDCGSANGTLLNGKGIFNNRPDLSSGDVLTVGPIELKLLLLD